MCQRQRRWKRGSTGAQPRSPEHSPAQAGTAAVSILDGPTQGVHFLQARSQGLGPQSWLLGSWGNVLFQSGDWAFHSPLLMVYPYQTPRLWALTCNNVKESRGRLVSITELTDKHLAQDWAQERIALIFNVRICVFSHPIQFSLLVNHDGCLQGRCGLSF